MYNIHYKYIKRKFNANLLFADTESLVYEIKTDDVYEDIYENKKLFDLGDYPQDSKFFDPANKKVIGKMKDEFKGKIISEFVGLKSKIYAIIVADGEDVKKVKRVNENVLKNTRHKEFVDVLFNKKLIKHKMKRIQSKLYRIGTYDVCKIYLSCFNDKNIHIRQWHSLTYYHKDVKSGKFNEIDRINEIDTIKSIQ